MNIKNSIFTCLLLLFFQMGISQNYAGIWTGLVSQKGKQVGYFYQLNLEQNGEKVTGTSYSKAGDESAFASFQVGGVVENGELILQEVLQIEPKGAKWCMKHLRLQLADKEGVKFLEGNWTAEGCTPGKVRLEQKKDQISEIELPLEKAILGNWTGQLSQSDRDYGFYYEVNLNDLPDGTSKIVSEDNGGTCTHNLKWEFDGETLQFSEKNIIKKSDGKWPWCMKSANLKFRKDNLRYVLEGDWWGYIEGHTQETGACAPGKLYLEKPIIKKQEIVEKTDMNIYEVETKRDVKITRILEVKSKNLRIKVWDNGIVDGDILTLFLNGEKLLENYRVTKNKRGVLVELKEKTNLLVLHAEDLGDIIPNTVAVSIDDGVREQVLILSSNLRDSGAVMIKQFDYLDFVPPNRDNRKSN